MPPTEISPQKTVLDPVQRFAIEAALTRYTFALDRQDLTALGDVLTEDAVWKFTITGQDGFGPAQGRTHILDFVREATAEQSDQRRHHLTSILVENVDTRTATVRAYLMLTSNADGSAHLMTTGFFTFTLHNAGDQWRIAELLLDLDSSQ